MTQVLDIRLAGAEFFDVRAYIQERIEKDKDPNWPSEMLSDSQVRRIIAKTDAAVARHAEKDRDKIFNRHVASRKSLYARCVNAADYSTALRVLQDEAELLNLYPQKKAPAPSVLPSLEQMVFAIINVEQRGGKVDAVDAIPADRGGAGIAAPPAGSAIVPRVPELLRHELLPNPCDQ